MHEFLSWWMGFEYFKLPSRQIMFWYLLIAIAVVIIRWLFFLKYLYLSVSEQSKKLELEHGGKEEKDLLSKIGNMFMAVICGPPIEEFMFRAPILWLVLRSEIINALVALCITVMIFTLVHTEPVGQYKDGTNQYRPMALLINIAIGGTIYGLLTIFTHSIWPAVLAHAFWNVIATLPTVLIRDSKKRGQMFDKWAQALQR